MVTRTDAATGLRVEDHPSGVPLVHQRSVRTLRLKHSVAVHRAPTGRGPGRATLEFHARLHPADVLVVALHGAPRPGDAEPAYLATARALSQEAAALVSVADPTTQSHPDLPTGWYLGGPGWEPFEDIARVILRAQGRTGARRVVFVGESAGGFAALRFAHLLPGSAAYVQNPQTALARHLPHLVDQYLRSLWAPLGPPRELLSALPERFDVAHLFTHRPSDALVYYLQSTTDPTHLEEHCAPFEAAVAGSPWGQTLSERVTIVRAALQTPGHAPPSPRELSHHLGAALAFFRERWGDAGATT